MKRELIYLSLVCCGSLSLSAQTATEKDSSKWGKWSIREPEEIAVLQSQQKKKNLKSAGTPGWRVRVFRENSRNARQRSLELVEQLKISFPNIAVYWNYESPFFKVSLGDFRSKEDAIQFVQKNKDFLPTAFVVSEPIFPAIPPLIPSLTPPEASSPGTLTEQP